MSSPRIFCCVLYCNGLHCFFKVLASVEISADVIGLSAHRSSFADGRGKEIAILVILAAVKGFLHCVHFLPPGILFFCLATDLFLSVMTYRRHLSLPRKFTFGVAMLCFFLPCSEYKPETRKRSCTFTEIFLSFSTATGGSIFWF